MIHNRRTGITCVRRTLCTINVIAWLTGCAVLACGIWLRVVYHEYGIFLSSALSATSVCLAVGVVTFVVALCGCCGSWISSKCMLITYFVLMTAVLVLEGSATALVLSYREHLSDLLRSQLTQGLTTVNFTITTDPATYSWNSVQETFKCCGVTGAGDWQLVPDTEKGWLPPTCCPTDEGRDQTHATCKLVRGGRWYRSGCYDAVSSWFSRRLHIIGAVGMSIAFLQILSLIAAMLLIFTVGEKRKSPTYKSYMSDTE